MECKGVQQKTDKLEKHTITYWLQQQKVHRVEDVGQRQEFRRYRDIETQRHETQIQRQRHREAETHRHRETETERQRHKR